MSRFDEIMDRATRPRRTVPIVTNGSLRQRIEAVEAELDAFEVDEVDEDAAAEPEDRRLGSRPKPKPKAKADVEAGAVRLRLAALYEEAKASTLQVVVEGMDGTAFRALSALHPPRRDDAGKVIPEDNFGVNEETFRAPLVLSCVVGEDVSQAGDPIIEPLDEARVQRLIAWVTDRQLDKLVSAALAVCRGDDAVPLPRPLSTTPTSAAE